MKTTENIVLITGGTSGIGLALARKFLDEGNKVIVTGTNADKAEAVQKEIPSLEIELADIRDRSSADRLVTKYPDVNILINNVGIQYNYEFADLGISSAQIETEIDINLVSLGSLTISKIDNHLIFYRYDETLEILRVYFCDRRFDSTSEKSINIDRLLED